MYAFAIREAYGSEELLIEFYPQPSDIGFQEALRLTLVPLGFSVSTTEHGIWASHSHPESKFGTVRIDSDAWSVFGETDPASDNPTLNRQLIYELGSILITSGAFQEVPWHGAGKSGD
ncbi:hypothetical protein PGC34_12825 [Pseudomonas kribbensis]|uniref:hypothetical protein n=1 Tax=Pseudomonas kribbensis TaxID=1628086 RepID=UPI003BF811AB